MMQLFDPYPALTICIPAHRPLLVADATASARAQTAKNIQIAVNFSDSYHRDKINEHPMAAAGEFVTTLCDDDLLDPYFAEIMLAKAYEGYDFVYCDYKEFGERTNLVPGGEWSHEGFRLRNPMCGLTFLIRTSIFRALEGFDTRMLFADWEFGYRAFKRRVRAAYVPLPLVKQRIHDGQATRVVNFGRAYDQIIRMHPELANAHARPFDG